MRLLVAISPTTMHSAVWVWRPVKDRSGQTGAIADFQTGGLKNADQKEGQMLFGPVGW